jgi:hypothetical protein
VSSDKTWHWSGFISLSLFTALPTLMINEQIVTHNTN